MSFSSTGKHSFSRRKFIRTAAATAVALPTALNLPCLHGSTLVEQEAETLIGELYQSLTQRQKEIVCLGFDNQKRHKISPNWHITKPRIGDGFFTDSQRTIIDRIVRGVTSVDGYKRLKKQMADDTPGGIDGYSIAIFGEPGQGKFQWEMTGRHLTMRADGNHVDQAAFGGPIVYGHSEEDPKKNLFYDQTLKVNEVFAALNQDQASKALLKQLPTESKLQLRKFDPPYAGLGVDELSADQKRLVEDALKFLLSPFRQADVTEAMDSIRASGGLDQLHLSFYKDNDLDNDQVWDMWRIEGPGMVWHFRGAPHVHAYINIDGGMS